MDSFLSAQLRVRRSALMSTIRQAAPYCPGSCPWRLPELEVQEAIVDVAFKLWSANMLWSSEAAGPVMSLPFSLLWGFPPDPNRTTKIKMPKTCMKGASRVRVIPFPGSENLGLDCREIKSSPVPRGLVQADPHWCGIWAA